MTAIIIGAGPAGLYCAHTIRKRRPNMRVIVFEKSDHIGGRAATEVWHGSLIYPGAEHIMPENTTLLKLCEEFKIPLRRRVLEIECYDNTIVEKGVRILEQYRGPDISVKDLLEQSNIDAEEFLINFGYTDMLGATVDDTVRSFGLRDFRSGNQLFMTDFNLLWKALAKNLDIRLETPAWIDSFDEDTNQYLVGCQEGFLKADEVYVCTDAYAAIQITKRVSDLPFMEAIGINPFVKLFVHIEYDKHISTETLKIHHCSENFQRVIEHDPTTLIVYCDGKYVADKPQISTDYLSLEESLSSIIGRDVNVLDTKLFYWPIGTHFWTNTSTTRSPNPRKNLFVLGEMNSDKQGWIEGALTLVDQVLRSF